MLVAPDICGWGQSISIVSHLNIWAAIRKCFVSSNRADDTAAKRNTDAHIAVQKLLDVAESSSKCIIPSSGIVAALKVIVFGRSMLFSHHL